MSTQEASFASAAVKAFKLNLDRSTKFFSALTPEQFETRIAPGKNRLIYLYGHLTAVNDAMFPLFGIGERLHPELDETFLKSPDGAAPACLPPLTSLSPGTRSTRSSSPPSTALPQPSGSSVTLPSPKRTSPKTPVATVSPYSSAAPATSPTTWAKPSSPPNSRVFWTPATN